MFSRLTHLLNPAYQFKTRYPTFIQLNARTYIPGTTRRIKLETRFSEYKDKLGTHFLLESKKQNNPGMKY